MTPITTFLHPASDAPVLRAAGGVCVWWQGTAEEACSSAEPSLCQGQGSGMFLGFLWSVNGVLILKMIVVCSLCSFTLVLVEIKDPRSLYLVWIFFG